MLASFKRLILITLEGLLGRSKTFQRFKMTPSHLSFKANLIPIVPRPKNTLSAVDLPILVNFSMKSVISFRSLQICTSVALSISQQFYLGSLITSTFGCQLSLLIFGFVVAMVS